MIIILYFSIVFLGIYNKNNLSAFLPKSHKIAFLLLNNFGNFPKNSFFYFEEDIIFVRKKVKNYPVGFEEWKFDFENNEFTYDNGPFLIGREIKKSKLIKGIIQSISFSGFKKSVERRSYSRNNNSILYVKIVNNITKDFFVGITLFLFYEIFIGHLFIYKILSHSILLGISVVYLFFCLLLKDENKNKLYLDKLIEKRDFDHKESPDCD